MEHPPTVYINKIVLLCLLSISIAVENTAQVPAEEEDILTPAAFCILVNDSLPVYIRTYYTLDDSLYKAYWYKMARISNTFQVYAWQQWNRCGCTPSLGHEQAQDFSRRADHMKSINPVPPFTGLFYNWVSIWNEEKQRYEYPFFHIDWR